MAAEYYSLVTDLGAREMIKAVSEGKKVRITEFAVGDGSGQQYEPDTGMQELRHEVWRGMVNSCRISRESENVMIIETVIPAEIGGFTIREMGIFSEDGIMMAVCNTPETQKVRVTDGVVHELMLTMEIALSSTDAVQLVVDQSVVTATKKDLENLRVSVEEGLENLREEFAAVSEFAAENREMILGLQDGADGLGERLALLELMYATDISKNPFTVTFATLEGTAVQGVWNETQKRIEF